MRRVVRNVIPAVGGWMATTATIQGSNTHLTSSTTMEPKHITTSRRAFTTTRMALSESTTNETMGESSSSSSTAILPSAEEMGAQYAELGRVIVANATELDAGKDAFDECLHARMQLETILRVAGYEMDVYTFGGLSVLGLFEVDGDVDFVAVSPIEPQYEEAGDIVVRISREMRRLGLKASAVPRARVPVVKVDRTSRIVPGTPLHSLSRWAIFQCTKVMSPEEQATFETRMKEVYGATEVEWNNSSEFASVCFGNTTELIAAIAQVSSHGSVAIPLRLPVEPRKGPELYRYQFDVVLSTMGLRNTHLLAEYLAIYPYARHLLLLLKRWARNSGVVDTSNGMLSSYAITVMLVHYLVHRGVIPTVDVNRISGEPNLLPQEPIYRPLAADTKSVEEMTKLGELYAGFFEYFTTEFNFDKDVVCTTQTTLTKETLKWTQSAMTTRPPFYHFGIKDPYSVENIARNLNEQATSFVKSAHRMALDTVAKDLRDPKFLLHTLTVKPPKPYMGQNELVPGLANKDSKEFQARHLLQKAEFHRRKDTLHRFGQQHQRRKEDAKVATNVTKSVVDWIKKSKH